MTDWIKIECCGCCYSAHYICPVCHQESFAHPGGEGHGFAEPSIQPCQAVPQLCRNCECAIVKLNDRVSWVHIQTYDGRQMVGTCEPDMQSMWAEP